MPTEIRGVAVNKGRRSARRKGFIEMDMRVLSVRIEFMTGVQIFGTKNSQATRAAERFFKERRVSIHFVDLKQKPMSPGEIKRFVDRFGLAGLVDSEGAAWVDGGLKYLKLSEAELLGRIERDLRLLRLPLVRAGNLLSVGQDEEAWKAMISAQKAGS